jgi:DNA repair exonuclease SbcCD ATPase subunit
VDVELDNSASDQQPPDVDLETLRQLKEQLEGAHVQILELKGQLGRAHMCIQQQKEQLQSQEEEMSCLKKQVKEQEDRLKMLSYDPDSFDDETVQFYLGLKSKCAFDALYHHLQDKASRMHYWRGENGDYDQPKGNTGPKRQLTTKHEFAAVLIRLKLGLFVDDLAARLGMS